MYVCALLNLMMAQPKQNKFVVNEIVNMTFINWLYFVFDLFIFYLKLPLPFNFINIYVFARAYVLPKRHTCFFYLTL